MKKFILILAFAISSVFNSLAQEKERIEPDATYLYAEKDNSLLYLDIYEPSDGSAENVDGIDKPTILFMFGGGFKSGSRDDAYFNNWFRLVTEAGYRIISIDYRLGLSDFSGAGINRKFINALDAAIDLAVEDLFSATSYLIEHSHEMGIDCSRLVLAGSSAGAISVLQAEYELCNANGIASVPVSYTHLTLPTT